MEEIVSIRPLLAVLVTLVAALLIIFTGGKNRNLREFWTIIASLIKFTIVLSMVPFILNGKTLEYTIITLTQGVSLQFRVDQFGMFLVSSPLHCGFLRLCIP